MGVVPVKSELVHASVETGNEEKSSLLHEKGNGEIIKGLNNESVKFSSQGKDEPKKGGANTVVVNETNLPKDAVDEWPAPKQIHSFYFIKYRSYDDQQLRAKLDQADRELQRLNQNRFQITEKLRAERADRAQVIAQLRNLGGDSKQYRMIMDEKRKEMEPLQQALGKLRNPYSMIRDRGFVICSSEEELNDLIKSLQYRIQHESIPLSEEKKILREIKQLEGTREKVIANAQLRAEIQGSLGEKEVIQDQVKHLGVDLDGVRKEQQVVKAKLKQLDDEKEAMEKHINTLQEELTIVTQKRDKAFEKIQELRKQRDAGNTCFYQNRTLLIKARELAAKKDTEALKVLADTEVETFMLRWSSTKAFRDNYEKRILASLDIRQLSRDGRMRNPDEKPLVLIEPPVLSEPEVVAKPKLKELKEESIAAPQKNNSSVQKVAKEKNNKQQKEENSKVTTGSESTPSDLEDRDGISGLEKQEKINPPPIDEAKLKEMKREEEIAKAKQASERKKKLAEKVAAKAAIKAQKEAEKKLKEREKKAKKKAAASASASVPEEPTEVASEVVEPEKAEEKIETPGPTKNKQRKENHMRNRSKPKGPDSLPKIILKRKKSRNHWVWAAPTALLVLMLAVFGYYYLL